MEHLRTFGAESPISQYRETRWAAYPRSPPSIFRGTRSAPVQPMLVTWSRICSLAALVILLASADALAQSSTES